MILMKDFIWLTLTYKFTKNFFWDFVIVSQ